MQFITKVKMIRNYVNEWFEIHNHKDIATPEQIAPYLIAKTMYRSSRKMVLKNLYDTLEKLYDENLMHLIPELEREELNDDIKWTFRK